MQIALLLRIKSGAGITLLLFVWSVYLAVYSAEGMIGVYPRQQPISYNQSARQALAWDTTALTASIISFRVHKHKSSITDIFAVAGIWGLGLAGYWWYRGYKETQVRQAVGKERLRGAFLLLLSLVGYLYYHSQKGAVILPRAGRNGADKSTIIEWKKICATFP